MTGAVDLSDVTTYRHPMTGTGLGTRTAGGGSLGAVVRAVALLLFAWQALVVQTHWHRPSERPTIVAAIGTQAAPAQRQPSGPLDCPVCREVAHAGTFLTPDAVVQVRPIAALLWRVAATLPVLRRAERSHAWHSRAPPSLLLA